MILVGGDNAWTWPTNNPGGLSAGSFANAHGAIGTYPVNLQFAGAIFPNYQTGRAAQIAEWETSTYMNKASLLTAINSWTGGSFTASSGYVTTMVGYLTNATAATAPSSVIPSQVTALASGQQAGEGWHPGQTVCGGG